MKDNVVLEVSHLKKYFDLGHGRTLHAVDDVSFSIREGETLGLVGESGCGKTTCGRTCLGMYNKTDGKAVSCSPISGRLRWSSRTRTLPWTPA